MMLALLIVYVLAGLVYCSNFGYFNRESLCSGKIFHWWGCDKKNPIYKIVFWFFSPVVLLYLFLKA